MPSVPGCAFEASFWVGWRQQADNPSGEQLVSVQFWSHCGEMPDDYGLVDI